MLPWVINQGPEDATMMMAPIVISDIGNDFTIFMSPASEDENTMTKKDKVVLPTNKKLSKNKKAMIIVASLIGNTQAIAEQTIVVNGYLLGNITNNYSDSIEEGLVISQTPVVDTSYEKHGKIDLVISQGKEIINTPVPTPTPVKEGKGKKRSTNLPLATWVALSFRRQCKYIYGGTHRENIRNTDKRVV